MQCPKFLLGPGDSVTQVVERLNEVGCKLGDPWRKQLLKLLKVRAHPECRHGRIVTRDGRNLGLQRRRPRFGTTRLQQVPQHQVLEMHRRAYISEAAIGGAHHQKRRVQLHATVIDVELGVSRQRIAHHGIPTEVGQGIARVPEIISAELARPSGLEDVNSRVARPEDMTGPSRTARLGAL